MQLAPFATALETCAIRLVLWPQLVELHVVEAEAEAHVQAHVVGVVHVVEAHTQVVGGVVEAQMVVWYSVSQLHSTSFTVSLHWPLLIFSEGNYLRRPPTTWKTIINAHALIALPRRVTL